MKYVSIGLSSRQDNHRPWTPIHCPWLTFAVQVSVAALLDNFISSSAQIEIEQRLKEAHSCVRDQTERNPMEPLLIKLAREFTDSQDLSDRLLKLYKVEYPSRHHLNH